MRHKLICQSVLAAVASALLLALVAPARAELPGQLGSWSQAEAKISLTISESVQISRVSDVHFPDWRAGLGSIQGRGQACVFSSSGGYRISARSGKGQGQLALSSGEQHRIAYQLEWISTERGAEQRAELRHGETHWQGFQGASSLECLEQGGLNAEFVVSITQYALSSAPAGTYSDTLSLIVSPE